VQTAAKFRSSITLRNLSRGGKEVDAKSILQVLTVGVDKGSTIELIAEGEDADQALVTLVELIGNGLGADG
jgi:phosphocarrier protein HPr